MACACDLHELAAASRLNHPIAVAPRLLARRFVVGAAMDHEQRHRRSGSRGWRRAGQNIVADTGRRSGNCLEVVKPADEHRAADAVEMLCSKQRGQVRAGVFAEQDQLVGVDLEVCGMAANERHTGTQVGE